MTDWTGVDMLWEGPDGSSWDLLSPDSPVTLEKVAGLHLPEFERFGSAPAGMDGATFRGVRAKARAVTWGVSVHSREGTDAWLEADRAWWRSLSYTQEGVWSVTVQGQTRRLRLRLSSTADEMPRDPTVTGEQVYALELEAAQPWWEGDPISQQFSGDVPTSPFFVQDGSSLFWISRGYSVSSAVVANPGDVPAWPIWMVTGPVTSFRVGVGGKAIEMPMALAAGEFIRIDSRPDQQTITDGDGVDRVGDAGAVDWGAIPPGAAVDLDISCSGAGVGTGATVSFVPRYRRAW